MACIVSSVTLNPTLPYHTIRRKVRRVGNRAEIEGHALRSWWRHPIYESHEATTLELDHCTANNWI